MFKRVTDNFLKIFREETLAQRKGRMVPGAIYCAIAATFYFLVPPILYVIFYSGAHLAIDWIALLTSWIEFGLVLALVGVIVGWFSETYEGIVYGGVVMAVLILVGNWMASLISRRGATLMGQSIIITILPLFGACILLAGVIRLAINRYLHIQLQENLQIRRRMFVQFTIIVFLVGLIPGMISYFGSASINTVRSMNKTLQNYATDNIIDSRFPYEKVPALKDHFGMDYTLYVRASNLMAGAMDITIRYKDGYSVTCLVPPTGSNEELLLNTCNEGTHITVP
jgi:hypothetical protein